MAVNWREKGIKAGKTEGWMRLEETLKEDLDRQKAYIHDYSDLVQTAIEGWEETGHFEQLYGQPMMDDAKEELGVEELNDDVIEKWQENKEEFWEGYLEGRRSIGKDIYKMAQRLMAKKSGRVVARPKSRTRSRKSGGATSILGGMR